MLPVLAMNTPRLTRRDILRLAVLSSGLLILPLIRLQDGATADEPAPKPKEERILYWWKEGRLATIRPDGKKRKWVTEAERKYHVSPTFPSLSPDGRRVAYGMDDANAPPVIGYDRTEKLFVKDLDEKGLGVDMGIDAHLWVWSPDGTKLAVTKWDTEAQKEKKVMKADHWLVDVKSKEKTELKIPDGQVITDWSRDGKWFLTTSITALPRKDDAPPLVQLNLFKREGGELRRLGDRDLSAAFGRFSPDGKKVLFMKMSREKRFESQLFVMDLADEKMQQVSQELNAELMGHCWSPDSKRIAYVWRQKNAMPNGQTESFLMIVDSDGKNPVTLVTEKSDNQGTITLSSPDWR